MKMKTVSLFLIICTAALVNGTPCLTFGPLLEMMINRALGFRRFGPEPGVWYGGAPMIPTYGVNRGFIPVGNGGGVEYGGGGGGGPVYQNGNGGYGTGYGQPSGGGGTVENVEYGRLRRV
ncbi:ATP-dependent RNA helicase DBP2 [Chelonus insularis]|uniref:ATP-dependent RNA helicase DBP2 n=1 Tax=Chelonus insularis TaxID=460826 RepID=UPI00158BDE95|nr:ATP-dependent RNA helicase DBP2-like [Chelonus insularis]